MRHKARGLSLIEVMVAGAMLLGLSVVFAAIFSQARSSSEGGAERIAMRATHRQTHKRLTILLRSAIAPNEVDPTIVEPAYKETSTQLRFHAPADLIDDSQPFDPRTPEYPEFTLRHDTDTGGLLLQRSDLSGPRQQIGDDFSTVKFDRRTKRMVTISLTSQRSIRGAAGSRKSIEQSSTNSVQIPGLR